MSVAPAMRVRYSHALRLTEGRAPRFDPSTPGAHGWPADAARQWPTSLLLTQSGPGMSRDDVAGLPSRLLLHKALQSLSLTIAAGSSQIQRNIVAERILGLPKER